MSIDPQKKYAFRDKEALAGENMDHGLEYCAAGIVAETNSTDGVGSRSGMDLVVLFISPWGEPNRAWRSLDEVILSEIDKDDYEYLESQIEAVFED